MQVHPTRAAIHLAIAGSVATAAGIALSNGAIVGWGGAVLVGLAVARAVTEVGVARIRAAGFEMLWRSSERVRRVARGESVEIEAELRNRDARAARYVSLRPVAAPELEVTLEPPHGEVPAGGRLRVTVRIHGRRVGRHAVHGLSLEVQGGPGLFEVPLTFANPFGVEVMPRAYARLSRSARGGRSRREAEGGRPSPFSGESGELRELRQHQAGDPFRRIAWKASARRGELLVREYERVEREVVFLLVDASVELYAGVPGEAALDRAIDEAAAVALRHLARGDQVGLALVDRRVLAWVPSAGGTPQAMRLLEALALAPTPVHADRSGLDESDVALRVLEHMRPFDPGVAGDVGFHEIDRIARRAERLKSRAPFPGADAFASSRRERVLRRYLEGFGLGSPLRVGPHRADADEILVQSLARLARERPRPSIVCLWSPAPEPGARRGLIEAAVRFRTRRSELLWASMPLEAGLPRPEGHARLVTDALARRAELAAREGERALRRMGVRIDPMPRAHAK